MGRLTRRQKLSAGERLREYGYDDRIVQPVLAALAAGQPRDRDATLRCVAGVLENPATAEHITEIVVHG